MNNKNLGFPPSLYRNVFDSRLVEARNPYTDVHRANALIEQVAREDKEADRKWRERNRYVNR